MERENEQFTEEESEPQSFTRKIDPTVLFRRIDNNENLLSLSDVSHYLVRELLLSQGSVSTATEGILPNN